MLRAAAFAYLSDLWLNFAAVGIHVPQLDRDGERLHVASLNHAIWFHRPFRVDGWLCFEVQSPCAGRGAGFLWLPFMTWTVCSWLVLLRHV
ncbi:hypothetical protein ACSFBM_19670 [Variovorax sp. GB1R11]|uniref:hypothetical protein n=1 Tax=Variovorax sp. GB1R11 TaxID=3443741 RepID=UPI003F44A766